MATYSDPTTIIPTGSPKKVETGPLMAIIAAVIAVVAVGGLFFTVYITKTQTTEAQATLQKKQDELAKSKSVSEAASTLETQAAALHQIFDNQVRWNTVISNLSRRLYSNIAVTSFQLDDASTFALKGYTTDYVSYAKFYRSLTDAEGAKYFVNVKPLSVEKVSLKNDAGKDTGVTQVEFTMNMKLTKEVMGMNVINPVTGAIQ